MRTWRVLAWNQTLTTIPSLWHPWPSSIYKALINAGASSRRERTRPKRREAALPVLLPRVRSIRIPTNHLLTKKRGALMPRAPSNSMLWKCTRKAREQGGNLWVENRQCASPYARAPKAPRGAVAAPSQLHGGVGFVSLPRLSHAQPERSVTSRPWAMGPG